MLDIEAAQLFQVAKIIKCTKAVALEPECTHSAVLAEALLDLLPAFERLSVEQRFALFLGRCGRCFVSFGFLCSTRNKKAEQKEGCGGEEVRDHVSGGYSVAGR